MGHSRAACASVQTMVKKKFLNGIIKRHPDGFGFLIPENVEHPDVYIPNHSMKGAMTNDRVMIDVVPEKGTQRFRGEIIRILSRGTKTVVGRYFLESGSHGAIRDEAKAWGSDLKIKREDSLHAKEGELVAVEILTYPGDGQPFTGRVREVIGDSKDPMNDIRRVLLGQNVPHEFPASVVAESQNFEKEVSEKDLHNRKDLRKLNFVTIDGVTAKDFDDAIYVKTTDKGFCLWVAIADVSHYVRVGSAIDREAYLRGTSVYFPNYVVPMLPEVLSNHLCSLVPHVPRLSLVAEMQMDFSGHVTHSSFYEAVIESKARVTYGEAQEIVDGQHIEKLKHVREDILVARDLAKILMAKRFREGSLDLEIPETQLQIDSSGNPVDIVRSERLFSHRLIEELMLAANVAVAVFLESRKIPSMFRVHDPPNEQAIQMLQNYIETFGGKLRLEGGTLQKKLTRVLEEFSGRPEAQILNLLTLRSLSQAKYSGQNVGHFGLGFDSYTHFTSPIRRYPDLIVHRLIKNQVMKNSPYRLMGEEEMTTAANMLSACEQRSVKVERQFQAIKKARFMVDKVGQEFDGIISSVARFGVFVLLREFDVDGLIRIDRLAKERLEYDEESLCLVAPRSGLSYRIGDMLRVKVTGADPDAGQIDFDLVNVVSSTPFQEKASQKQKKSKTVKGKSSFKERKSENSERGKANRKDDKKRGKTKNNRRGLRKARVSQSGRKNSPR